MEKRRFVLVVSALALVVGGLGVVGSGPGLVASAAAVPSCNVANFTASSSIQSRPGGTTIRLVMVNRNFPKCQWPGSTRYQFLTAQSLPIGAAVSEDTGVMTMVDSTFPVVSLVSTMEGVQCSQKVATSIAVIGANSRRVVHLSSPTGVCASGPAKWTTVTSVAFPQPTRCTLAALKVTLGQSQGAAGTIYYPLVLTNRGVTPCVVSGIPRVQPGSASSTGVHASIGPAATLEDLAASGYGEPIRLVGGASASANFGVAQSANYPTSRCRAANFSGVTVLVGGIGRWWVTLPSSTCTKVASTHVSGLVPTSTGMAP